MFNQLATQDRLAALAFVDRLQQHFTGDVVSVILYGSRARGDAGLEADMDILVVLESVNPDIRREVNYLAAETWLEYGIFVSPLIWSQAQEHRAAQLQTSLYQNIEQDGIELFRLSA